MFTLRQNLRNVRSIFLMGGCSLVSYVKKARQIFYDNGIRPDFSRHAWALDDSLIDLDEWIAENISCVDTEDRLIEFSYLLNDLYWDYINGTVKLYSDNGPALKYFLTASDHPSSILYRRQIAENMLSTYYGWTLKS